MGRFKGWTAVAIGLAALGLAACAGPDETYTALPREPGRNLALETHQKPLECVPYARAHSDIKIYGDAWTWWEKASGRYERGAEPQQGAVLVLSGYAGPQRAHVAVVRRVVSSREIRIDHANWLDDGSIYINDPVVDVSADNDWSQVKVWNIKTGGWGGKTYPVQGFISTDTVQADGARIARADPPAFDTPGGDPDEGQ